ncbi:MAG: FeoB-associated Cys-rich membrane protein [Clostridia bacterium]|nr:FeoB-associated Cys-rich membrane protein [Clostridia bacterium]
MIATIIITGIILTLVAWIIINKIRNRRNGHVGCGCGCQGCAMSEICHKETADKKIQ